MIKLSLGLSIATILIFPSGANAQDIVEAQNIVELQSTDEAQSVSTISSASEFEPPIVIEDAHFDHRAFDALLQKYVTPITGSSVVNYHGFASDRPALQNYLASLARVSQDEFDGWPLNHQLAFLINAYNAGTIELILTRYPDIKSIRQISSPWGQKFVSLFGDNVSLDTIEHGLIRGDRYNEPRIHFAVNCASIGCPPLLNAAYRGDTLDEQLDASTKLFLSDKSRNYLDGDRIYVSKIFKWYEKDFEQGWGDANSLGEFLALYKDALGLSNDQVVSLRNGDIKIKTTSYDWKLNSVDKQP